jgi:hypothetical protein
MFLYRVFFAILVFVTICTLAGSSPSALSSTQSQTVPAKFDAPPIYSVAGSEVGVTGFNSMVKGDFNGDGFVDFTVVGFSCANGTGYPANSIAVYLGNGDGTFKPPTYYSVGSCPDQVAVARTRGANAAQDIIVIDNNNVWVLLGKGDGTFEDARLAGNFTNYSLTAVTVGDFNGDGKVDLAVSLFGGLVPANTGLYDAIGVLLGNGDGTFQAPLLSQSPADNNYDIAVGDFNNDGKLDVLTRPGLGQHGLYLSLGNGDGTFLPAYLVWTEPISIFVPLLNGINTIAVGDFNGDGNLDVALNVNGARVDVLLGTGTGTFAPVNSYVINQHQTGNGLGHIAAAQLTDSGHLDLVTTTGFGSTLALFYGNGDGTFQTPTVLPLPEEDTDPFIVADVNGDGKSDIVTGTDALSSYSGAPQYLTVLLNHGNGNFGDSPLLFAAASAVSNNQATASNAIGLTLADLTGNGKLDLVTTDWDIPIETLSNGQIPMPPTVNPQTQQVDTHGSISVLPGNGDASFGTEVQYETGARPIAVAAADLDGDGKQDLVTVNAAENDLSILKGNGDRTFQPAITIAVGTNPNAIAVADFNGDGKPDIAVTNLVDNTVSILINQSTAGSISFAAPVNYSVDTYPSGVVARDFNHDGKLDLAVLNSGNYFSSDPHTSLSILLGNGDGTFQSATSQQLWTQYGGDAIAAADFGRGQIDLAVANFSINRLMILKGNGDGTFTQAGVYQVGFGPEGIVAADFNGDGKIDFVVNNLNDNTITIFLGNGDATFAPAAQRTDDVTRPFGWATWGYPAFITAGDLNGDGKPEIVTTHIFEAAASVLRNTTPSVPLTGIVSRKVHGTAGTFDVDLTNGNGIECRGTDGSYTLVFRFVNPLSSVSSASVTSGSGSVATSNIDPTDAHNYIVNLTGVANAQRVTVNLANVTDSAGNVSSAVSAQMGVLLGDVNASGHVDAADVSSVRQQTLQPVTSSNFREDINASGRIDAADVSIVRQQTLTSLP